jgi:hypothetical protein
MQAGRGAERAWRSGFRAIEIDERDAELGARHLAQLCRGFRDDGLECAENMATYVTTSASSMTFVFISSSSEALPAVRSLLQPDP